MPININPKMTIMKKITLLLLSAGIFFAIAGCIKTLDPSNLIPEEPVQPSATAVGEPTGAIVSQSIGKGGGSIISADGNTELVFPANALDNNTDISVQAISNTAPNGVGNAYRFLPEGIKFLQPVLLKIHYTADDLAATLADLMAIAFQDSVGGWWRLNNYTNDTVNKIISAPIRHFTDYTHFDILRIRPLVKTVQVGKSQDLEVDVIESDDKEIIQLNGDPVAPLIKTASKKVIWSVNGTANGSSKYGKVSGNALNTTFTAPDKVPQPSSVAVSAQVDIQFTDKGVTFNKTSLVIYIEIIDAQKFRLELTVTEPNPLMVYEDHANMNVLLKPDGTVVVSDIDNFAPTSNPESYTDGGCTLTWLPDPIGEVNIVTATGSTRGTDPILTLEFTHSGTWFSSYRSDCEGGDSETRPGYSIFGFPSSLTFTLDKDMDSFDSDDGHVKAILTRTND
jgi:hypothetical protein